MRTVFRAAGATLFLGYLAGVAYLGLNWSSIVPSAASQRLQALIDSGASGSEQFTSAVKEVSRFNPSIASYADAVAAEIALLDRKDASVTYETVVEKYDVAISQSGSAQSLAMVRLAKFMQRFRTQDLDAGRVVNLLKNAAALGNRRAAYELALVYLNGTLVPSQPTTGARLLLEASDSVPEAAMKLASLYNEKRIPAPSPSSVNDLVARALWQYEARVKRDGTHRDMIDLARVYSGSLLDKPNYERALFWFVGAAENGDDLASMSLADFYAKPDTGFQDLPRAREIYASLSDRGLLPAMVKMADFSRKGIGGPSDQVKATELYAKAADLGSVAASYRLAIALRDGLGVAVDRARSIELLKKAAEGGSVGAAGNLARAYELGEGIEKDPDEAFRWYSFAASRGAKPSIQRLAYAYQRGDIVKADPKLFLQWALKAIDAGSTRPDLQTAVGVALIKGGDIPVNRERGFKLVQDAAASGRPAALLALARCYAFGLGVEQDAKTAIRWYEAAAQKGRVAAYWELGRVYASGFGVPLNESLAFDHFIRAATSGYTPAMIDLGRMYTTGFGASRDLVRAEQWLVKAADAGDTTAMVEISNIYRERGLNEETKKQIVYWLNKASDKGSARADYVLALDYIAGDVVEKDLSKAEELLQKGADKKHPPSKARLKLLRQQLGTQ